MEANLSRFASRRLIREPLRTAVYRSLAAMGAPPYSGVVSQCTKEIGW
jgi:hypothetical protein